MAHRRMSPRSCRGVAQFKHLKSIAGRHLVYDAVSAGVYRPERDGLASAHLFEHIERLLRRGEFDKAVLPIPCFGGIARFQLDGASVFAFGDGGYAKVELV